MYFTRLTWQLIVVNLLAIELTLHPAEQIGLNKAVSKLLEKSLGLIRSIWSDFRALCLQIVE